MIEEPEVPPDVKGAAWRIVRTLGSSLAICAVLILAYGYAPEPTGIHPWATGALIVFFLIVYFGLTIVLLVQVKYHDHLAFPGLMVLTVLITFFILSFAWLYRQLEAVGQGTFSEPFTDVSAVYFTVAVVTTVGFGDIRPLDDLGRAAVTIQMILGVVLLTTAIGLISQAIKHVTRTPKDAQERLERFGRSAS